jgi:hypothetical protein
MNDVFACHLACQDGRVTDAVSHHARVKHGIDWVDNITEPGINKILAENIDTSVIKSIKRKIPISIHHHGSNVIFISGHPKCAGNPAGKEEQIKHLRDAKKTVESFGFGVNIVLLWIENDWATVKEIDPAL